MRTAESAVFPIPVEPQLGHLQPVDVLRGLLMVLMVLDHTREFFFSAPRIDATDPWHSWPALFLTRWITHLCAPGFVALAGTSVLLQRQRGKTRGRLQWLLTTRGLWLVFLELTLVSFGWFFAPGFAVQVIWAIGISMVFLACVLPLPVWAVGALGAAICLLHNLLDPVHAARFPGEGAQDLWRLAHEQGPLLIAHHFVGIIAYPAVPWLGVMCLGYAFGALLRHTAAVRQSASSLTGLCFLGVFAMLRVLDGYGDHIRFARAGSPTQTAMRFFELEKYPPSLQYLLATLGILLLLYAAIDHSAERGLFAHLRGSLAVFGRVPFFFYILHIYLLHLAALLASAALGLHWQFWLQPGSVFFAHLPGWGVSLAGVYAVWAAAVLLLYLPCRWFGQVKATRRAWWLSYL